MENTADPPLLDTHEAARFLGLKNSGTLCNWRTMKKGPVYIRVGSNVRYALTDLQTWLTERRVLTHKW